jgi:hypothetical protein
MRTRLLILAIAIGLTAAPLLGQPALTGPEFFVDPGTPGSQLAVSAAANSSGEQIAVWTEQRLVAPSRIRIRVRGRLFDSSGAPLGPAFTVQDTSSLQSQQWYPDAALDPSGGFVVVWQAGDSSQGRSIQGRRFDAAGRPLGNGFVISGASTPGVAPRVAMDAAGGFVVVWTRPGTRTMGRQVLARRYTASGQPAGPALGVGPENSRLDRFHPEIEMLPGGEHAIVWSEYDLEHRQSRLLVRAFDRSGSPLGSASAFATAAKRLNWGASLAPVSGGWVAVWAGPRKAEGYRIFGQTIGRDGGLAGAAFHIGTSSADVVEHPRPRIAALEEGSLFAVWPHHGLSQEIHGRHFSPAGELFGPERRIHDSSFGFYEGPVVAGSGDGSFTVFWTGFHDGEATQDRPLIAAQRLRAGGGPGTLRLDQAVLAVPEGAAEPVVVQVQRRDGTEGAVQVEVRAEGAASGSWLIEFANGDALPQALAIPVPPAVDRDEHVIVSLGEPTGGAVLGEPRRAVVEVRNLGVPSPLLAQAGPTIKVARTLYPLSQENPSVASDASGGFIVSWLRWSYENGSLVVAGARFGAAGDESARFHSDSYPGIDGRPLLAIGADGGLVQAWNDLDRTTSHGQRRDLTGAPQGPAFSFGAVVPLALAPAPGGFWWAVAAGQDSAGTGLFLHRYRGDGVAAGPPIRVSGPILMQPAQADLAADAAGNLAAVWTVPPSPDGPGGIFAQLFQASGAPRGPAFLVGNGGFGFDTHPAVAMAASGQFVVAWQRFDDDQRFDVFARSFDASGTANSEEIQVNTNVAGFQILPSVAMQDDGRFLVAWEDWHVESWSDAPRGQYFDRSGTRLGGEIEIAPRGRDVDVSTNGAGLYVVAWEGNTSAAGSFIAARRFPAPPQGF